MDQEMQGLLQWRVDMTIAGHYARLANQYRYPVTMHLDTGTLIVRDQAEMETFFDQLRADWKARGVNRLKVEVTAVGEPRHGKFRIWATLREYGASGWLVGQRNYVQYCCKSATGVRTEMFESIRASAAQTWPPGSMQSRLES